MFRCAGKRSLESVACNFGPLRLRRLPPGAPVLVFGSTRLDLFREPVIDRLPARTLELPTGGGERVVYLSLGSVLQSLRALLGQYDWSVSLSRNLYLAYLHGVLRALQPKAVLAFYDAASPVFGPLAARLPGIKMVAAFPGPLWWRQVDMIRPGPVQYLVPAEWDREKLVAAGVGLEQVEVIGSLYGSAYHRYRGAGGSTAAEYDICIVSQIGTEGREVHDAVERDLCHFVVRFVRNARTPVRVAVARRPQRSDAAREREQAFFEEHMRGIVFDLVPHDSTFSTYEVASRSRVTITHYSTVGFDLLWLGRRVLFFQTPATRFPVPDDMVFCTRRGEYEEFSVALHELLTLTAEEYLSRTADNRKRHSGILEEGDTGTEAVVAAVLRAVEEGAG